MPRVEFSLPALAQENMDEDQARLLNLKEGDAPLLRFYKWTKPSLTYGYFTDPAEWLELDIIKSAGYDLGKRPTGGGILFHTHDLAFSLIVPKNHPKITDNTLENYFFVNSIVKEAILKQFSVDSTLLKPQIKNSSFCMAEPTVFDVMIEGKKVGGAAQRRTKTGLLHQGTICLNLPNFLDLTLFLKDKSLIQKMQQNSFPLNCTSEQISHSLTEAFIEAFA